MEESMEQLGSLPREVQLTRVLEVLSAADDCVEWLGQLTSRAWDHMVENELWTAGSMSLDEVKERIDWVAVSERIAKHRQTQKRKDGEIEGISKRWACRPEEALPEGTWPGYASCKLLQHMHRLSKHCERDEGVRLVMESIQQRVQRAGGLKAEQVMAMDVLKAIDKVKALNERDGEGDGAAQASDGQQQQQQRRKSAEGNACASVGKEARARAAEASETCSCPPAMAALIPGPGEALEDSEGIELVRKARREGLSRLCHRHIRLLASGALGLRNNMSNSRIKRRLEHVYWRRFRLGRLRRKKAGWFREERLESKGQGLGAGAGAGAGAGPASKDGAAKEFEFDEVQVFERFGGSGSWKQWQEDGTINISGVFDYLGEEEMQQMISMEFDMYRHHHRRAAGDPGMGWRRNMFFSLIQQLARQDPVWYALTASARADKNWRLISYPYITKDAEGEKTGFLHLDLDLTAYMASGQAGNRVAGSLSLDDEDSEGCTVVVKGFHKHIGAWHSSLVGRGWKGSGHSTNCSDSYKASDRRRWGSAVGVPCRALDVRLTEARMIHGSTAESQRRRRTVLTWLTGIGCDHETLEVDGCLPWSEVRRCHLDLEAPSRGAGGAEARYGMSGMRFEGSVVLGSSSALGDALVGRRKWTDAEVRLERDVVLGGDSSAAWKYVQEVRGRLVSEYRRGFSRMARIEGEAFGKSSYFRGSRDSSGDESDSSMSSLECPSDWEM